MSGKYYFGGGGNVALVIKGYAKRVILSDCQGRF
jgi:hypothetical protein